LFSDVFEVTQIDANGKKFDRVSRIAAISEQTGMTMELDVNVEIYPVSQGDHLVMMLVSSLSLSGDDGPAAQRDEWRSGGTATKTLADDYDYVMHGK
ncbi:nucleic acid-binding protein, partial [Caulochytrium protostelioides]